MDLKVEELYYPCSENKGVDQLGSTLCLLFTYAKCSSYMFRNMISSYEVRLKVSRNLLFTQVQAILNLSKINIHSTLTIFKSCYTFFKIHEQLRHKLDCTHAKNCCCSDVCLRWCDMMVKSSMFLGVFFYNILSYPEIFVPI